MIKEISLNKNISSYLVREEKSKPLSKIESVIKNRYSDEQIKTIQSKIAECEELIRQYPSNTAARETLDIYKNMLKPIA